jgi:hypothetical protein
VWPLNQYEGGWKMADIDRDKRIKRKIATLNEITKNINDNRKKVVYDLICNIAFMAVQLEDLQAEINASGCIEKYCNGANQFGTKQSSALQAYTALIKNYQISLRQLLAELPETEPQLQPDDFDNFSSKK